MLKRPLKTTLRLFALVVLAILFLCSFSFTALIATKSTSSVLSDSAVVLSESMQNSGSEIRTHLTSEIIVSDALANSYTKLKANGRYLPQDISPSVILRGDVFVVSGQLTDLSSGEGIPNEPIEVFWSFFSWVAYETDLTNLRNNYRVGTGTTDSNGDFSISCRDSALTKAIGTVTVYAVFPGDPILGPIEENRQFTTDVIDCYATTKMSLTVNDTTLRDGEGFSADVALRFDNDTSLDAADGYNVTFNFLGTPTDETVAGFTAAHNYSIPGGTTVGEYELFATFNVSQLAIPFVVNDATSTSVIGTSAADFLNESRTITVTNTADVTIAIDDPIAPGPGEYPEIVRGETELTLSGTVTNSTGGSFGIAIDLDVYIHYELTQSSTYRQVSTTTDLVGDFSVTLNVTTRGGYTPRVGDNFVWVNVSTGQGISATTDFDQITIYGNSSFGSPQVNGSSPSGQLVKVGETLRVTGTLRDSYDNTAIVDSDISAYWDGYGIVYTTNTSASGSYTLDMLIPTNFNASLMFGTIIINGSSTTYNTGSSTSFQIDIFTSTTTLIWLNGTSITNGSRITNLAGNFIYNNSEFTLRGNTVDTFNRTIDRGVSIYINDNFDTSPTVSNGNFTRLYNTTGNNLPGEYNFVLSFDSSYNITFTVVVTALNPPTPTPTPTPTTTPFGGSNLTTQTIIWISVGMVSSIVVIAGVYAFGRFRKTRQRPGKGREELTIPNLMKQIDEAEKAKDFRRAVILCYRVFELICMETFGIYNAQSQSPRELARSIAATSSVPVRDITVLVMKYEEARFSDHSIRKKNFTDARQALHNLQLAIEKNGAGVNQKQPQPS